MTQTPDVVEQQIIEVLDEVSRIDRTEGGMPNRRWTELIKEGLCRLGKAHGFGVSTAGSKGADTGEWLFDLVWAAGEGNLFQSLELAMECEWIGDNDQLLWDFEKLLIAKSTHKLFVYQGHSEADIRTIADLLTSKVDAFKCTIPGERYLLAGWASRQKTFVYNVVSCDNTAG